MEQNFLSPRWYGRLLNLLVNLAYSKGISLDIEELTLRVLYDKVFSESTSSERNIIDKLLQKWNEQKLYEVQHQISISDDESKKLQKKGFNDVLVVLHQGKPLDCLIQNVDFYTEEENRLVLQRKKRGKKRIVYGGIIAGIFLAFVMYNLPYFKEMRFYNVVMEERTLYQCTEYYDRFPDGRHYEDVLYLETELSSEPVKTLMKYLKQFPNGKYSQEVNVRLDALWDTEISKYEKKDKKNQSPAAVKYMTEMLQYMKHNRVNTILLNVNSNVTLKDFDEYDDRTKTIINSWFEGEAFPLKGNLLSLKENFTVQDQEVLTQILADGVQKSFNNMFSTDLVSIVTSPLEAADNSPVLSFDYTIKNRNDNDIPSFPSIWTYLKDGTPKAYILAIDVKFNAKFSIPGSDAIYEYSEIGDPGNEIKDIQDVKDGYRQMTQICFLKFSTKMSENLGLEICTNDSIK